MTFAPLAWLKLLYFCHAGDTEIGGFGISAADNLLYVEDFVAVRQQATALSVRFLDDAVADYFDACFDQGLTPARCGRIWCHTHPGRSAQPSSTDDRTFRRSFASCDWAVMMILARGGATYARLAFSAGPSADIRIAVRVDWSVWPQALAAEKSPLDVQVAAWHQEFTAQILGVRLFQQPLDPSGLSPLPPARAPWWEDETGPLQQEAIQSDISWEVNRDAAAERPPRAGA